MFDLEDLVTDKSIILITLYKNMNTYTIYRKVKNKISFARIDDSNFSNLFWENLEHGLDTKILVKHGIDILYDNTKETNNA